MGNGPGFCFCTTSTSCASTSTMNKQQGRIYYDTRQEKKGPVFLGKRADRLILEIPSLAFRQFLEGLKGLGREAAANLFSFSFSFFFTSRATSSWTRLLRSAFCLTGGWCGGRRRPKVPPQMRMRSNSNRAGNPRRPSCQIPSTKSRGRRVGICFVGSRADMCDSRRGTRGGMSRARA